MAQATPLAFVSFEEYLDFEETTPEKHELFRGRIYAMAGGSSNHDDIVVSLTQACGRALQGRKPCRFLGENRKVRIKESGSGYRPDGAIACPPNDFDRRHGAYDNPTVVFEVLSPSTERFDRTDKYDDYRTLPSLQDYVLIETERIRVEVFSRLEDGGWVQRVYLPGTVAHLPSIGIDLPLDEVVRKRCLRGEFRQSCGITVIRVGCADVGTKASDAYRRRFVRDSASVRRASGEPVRRV